MRCTAFFMAATRVLAATTTTASRIHAVLDATSKPNAAGVRDGAVGPIRDGVAGPTESAR